jgi:hypothetical protein
MHGATVKKMLYPGWTRCEERIMDIVLRSVESCIVDCTLKERSSYSWLSPGGGGIQRVQ